MKVGMTDLINEKTLTVLIGPCPSEILMSAQSSSSKSQCDFPQHLAIQEHVQ